MNNISSSITLPTKYSNIKDLLQSEDLLNNIKTIHRSQLLPHLFKIRGAPFSLDDYPQFKVMYDKTYVPDTIFICGRQIGKCLDSNTIVFTETGAPITIENLYSNNINSILSFDGKNFVSQKIINKFKYNNKQICLIKTRFNQIKATPEHRLLIYNGGFKFVPVKYISTSDYLCLPVQHGIFNQHSSKCKTTLSFDSCEKCTISALHEIKKYIFNHDNVFLVNRKLCLVIRSLLLKFGIPIIVDTINDNLFKLIVIEPFIDKFLKLLNISKPNIYYENYDRFIETDNVLLDNVISVEYLDKAKVYDIEVSNTHNYMANFIISHNSLNLSRSEIFDLISIPEFQILYVAPLRQQAGRYSSLYINEAINSCPLARTLLDKKELERKFSDNKIINSVNHKALANGSGIQLTYAKTSPDRARGIYADRIDFDEIQDQLVDNIPIISESLTASKYGVRVFTGTAKTTDNTIESLWQKSSMCEWAIPCQSCNAWAIPNEDGRVLDMIQADGIHCVECGAKLNPRLGQWVPAYPDRMNEFRGYHIPQIVIPAIVEDSLKWSRLIRKMLFLPLPIIMQEILGISCSLGARIITQKDIERQSTLPSVVQLQSQLRNYVLTVGGVDWGGAEQQSFTVHTIIGVKASGQIDVLWARRFIGFNPDETLSEIAKAHRFYNCVMLAADYGMGFDKNIMLEQRFSIPVVQIMLLNQNRLFNYSPTLGHHRWTVDKTTSLELLFLAIKYGKIFFPPQSEFKIYTDDLLSPFEEVIESGGLSHRRFLRNPARPDDFCMALNFACLLAMKLVNSSMVDILPPDALNATSTERTTPAIVNIDPSDIVAAIK